MHQKSAVFGGEGDLWELEWTDLRQLEEVGLKGWGQLGGQKQGQGGRMKGDRRVSRTTEQRNLDDSFHYSALPLPQVKATWEGKGDVCQEQNQG